MLIIFHLFVILFAIIIHEVAHGLAALKLGDDTAERAGRLTLNPIVHLDPVGSVLVPLILFFTTSGNFLFGWAKPVPYNPFLLKNPRRDSALLAFAGPAANLSIALFFGIFIRVIFLFTLIPFQIFIPYFEIIVLINIMLAIFNLMPIPPLDGSKILFYFFPSSSVESFLNQYGILILFGFVFFGFRLIFPLVLVIFYLITGYSLS